MERSRRSRRVKSRAVRINDSSNTVPDDSEARDFKRGVHTDRRAKEERTNAVTTFVRLGRGLDTFPPGPERTRLAGLESKTEQKKARGVCCVRLMASFTARLSSGPARGDRNVNVDAGI